MIVQNMNNMTQNDILIIRLRKNNYVVLFLRSSISCYSLIIAVTKQQGKGAPPQTPCQTSNIAKIIKH